MVYPIKVKTERDILPGKIAIIDCAADGCDGYRLELSVNKQKYLSEVTPKDAGGDPSDFSEVYGYTLEYALFSLQNNLPKNMTLLCCLSCRYGNFCPYGGDKMYCFKAFDAGNIKDKSDVVDIFSKMDGLSEKELLAIRRLPTYACGDYEKIDGQAYTYNNWPDYVKR